MSGKVDYLNPAGLHKSPAFTQAVLVSGEVKTLYIGTQCAVDKDRNIVGENDIKSQTEQVLKNIDICLEAAGGKREHLIYWNIYIVEGQDINTAVGAAIPWLKDVPNPPANNVLIVKAFPNPGFLVGIDATAIIPN